MVTRILIAACFLFLAILPTTADAQCCDQEVTAVFVVDGIHPGTDLQLRDLMIRGTEDVSYPSDKDMIEAVAAVQPNDYCNYVRLDTAVDLVQFFCEPMDFGGIGLVDQRTGEVAFAGTTVWMGTGAVTCPPFSTHAWSWPAEPAAAPPSELGVLHSPLWPDLPEYDSQETIAAALLTYLRGTDVLMSFAACGTYSAVSYIYVPTACCEEPVTAAGVVVVRGTCGPPFNNQPIAVDRKAWSGVKALYR